MAEFAPNFPREEGYVDVGPGRVWWESAGRGPTTLLLLHGGPGGTSDDLAPLMVLAADGYRVVRYEQLGSYRSDKPDDPGLWRLPRFVAEVETVRRALGLSGLVLLGQSWGALLALEYALHHQEHLRGLVLASGAASTAECVAGMIAWRRELPADHQAALARHEATGAYDHPDYRAAIEVLYRRHLCRRWPFPEPIRQAAGRMAAAVYTTMWGPNEFACTGNLLDFDRTDRLGDIRVPTLVTCGRYDEVHPSCAETLRRGIPDAELVVFEHSAHLAHLEEPQRYLAVLRGFLARVDGIRPDPARR